MKKIKQVVYKPPNFLKQKWTAYWPLMVWVGVALGAVIVNKYAGTTHTMQGTVHKVIDSISSLETARILSIEVVAGDYVEAGDVLVQLDTTQLEAEKLMFAEQINTAKHVFQVDQLTLKRQFSAAVHDAEISLREAQSLYEQNKAELDVLGVEVERLNELLKKRLVDATTVADTRAREAVVRKLVELGPDSIASLKSDVALAKSQLEETEEQLRAAMEGDDKLLLAKHRSGSELQRSAIGLIESRKEAYTIRAKHAGVIAEIIQQPGDVALEGIPALIMIVDAPLRVVGFLPEGNLQEIAIGTEARIRQVFGEQKAGVMIGRVTAISPCA